MLNHEGVEELLVKLQRTGSCRHRKETESLVHGINAEYQQPICTNPTLILISLHNVNYH